MKTSEDGEITPGIISVLNNWIVRIIGVGATGVGGATVGGATGVGLGTGSVAVSYTHLTLPTIYSV